jgi:hypothetical protein
MRIEKSARDWPQLRVDLKRSTQGGRSSHSESGAHSAR